LGEKRLQMVIDQVKERSEQQIVNLQSQLRVSADTHRELQDRCKALQLKIDILSEERNHHFEVIESCKSQIETLEEHVDTSKAELVDLSKQLVASYNQREDVPPLKINGEKSATNYPVERNEGFGDDFEIEEEEDEGKNHDPTQ